MTDKIWYEMVNMKFGEIYLSKYLSLQQTLKKAFNILTLVLSISGIIGWKYFEDYAWIAFVLIAIMQLFTLIENEIIRSDKEIEEIALFKMEYTKYFNELERLWSNYRLDDVSEKSACDKYFKLKKKYGEKIESIDSKINIRRYKRMMEKSDEEMNQYFNLYHKK